MLDSVLAHRDTSESPEVRVLVTGANGFVGRVLVAELIAQKSVVRGAVRHPGTILPGCECMYKVHRTLQSKVSECGGEDREGSRQLVGIL